MAWDLKTGLIDFCCSVNAIVIEATVSPTNLQIGNIKLECNLSKA